MDGAVGQSAKASGFQRLAHLLDCHIEAVLVAGRNLDTLFLAAVDDLVGISNAHRHRLFDDDVDTVVDAEQGNLCVYAAFGGNAHQLRLLLLNHLPIIGVTMDGAVVLQLMLCQQVFHLLRQDVADRCQLQMVVQNCFDMVGCDSSAAD